MAAQSDNNVNHAGLLVRAAACCSATLRTKAGALEAAARVIAELLLHIDHPGLFVGGTHCGWTPRVTKAGCDCTSPEVVAALPEEILRPVMGEMHLYH